MSLPRALVSPLLIGGTALVAFTLSAAAQDRNPAIGARQGHMQVMALNIGILGNMARGNTDYDAAAAQAAADNLMQMGMIDQRFYWPEGTDSDAIEGTRALPAIWADQATFAESIARFSTASAGLAEVAGGGLEALQAGIGPVGAACGACHESFQQER